MNLCFHLSWKVNVIMGFAFSLSLSHTLTIFRRANDTPRDEGTKQRNPPEDADGSLSIISLARKVLNSFLSRTRFINMLQDVLSVKVYWGSTK